MQALSLQQPSTAARFNHSKRKTRCGPCVACPLPRPKRGTACRPQAVTDLAGNLLTTACIGTSLVLIARELLTRRAPADDQLHTDDNFRWGLMGFISCIPVFNWLAWVLAATDSENPRPYLWLAGLYGSTLLTNGFDQDAYSLAMLALGALHVQVARITATEPQLQQRILGGLSLPAVLRTSTAAAKTAVKVVVGTPDSSKQQLPQASSSKPIGDVLFSSEELQAEEELIQQQLAEFDRQLDPRRGAKETAQPQRRGKRVTPQEDDDDW